MYIYILCIYIMLSLFYLFFSFPGGPGGERRGPQEREGHPEREGARREGWAQKEKEKKSNHKFFFFFLFFSFGARGPKQSLKSLIFLSRPDGRNRTKILTFETFEISVRRQRAKTKFKKII